MAKRPNLPPAQPRQLSPDEMRVAIARFKRRIAELEQFDPSSVRDRSDPRITSHEAAIDQALSDAFGHGTPDYRRYSVAAILDRAGMNVVYGTPLHELIEGLHHGKAQAIALLGEAARSFEERLAEMMPDSPTTAQAEPIGSDIFIVHGGDVPAKVEVARLIERAGLKAVVLHEQPNAGRTIIEKFEAHGGAAGFAVVLLTPDDVGGTGAEQLRPRARQNVIGEMFWFAGKLGRNRVCALRKGDVEMPSDFAGIVYTEMDDRGAWKSELLRELDAAGYTVDWKRALA